MLSDESDFTREVIRVWRENVFAAENEGEQQKMEDLYNRLDEERKRLNDPDTWGWGGEPDELNDWAGDWPDGAVYEPHRWGEQRQPHSDKTPEGLSSPRNLDPSFLKLVADCAEKLHGDGRQRCYAFAQVSWDGYLINLLDPSDLVPFPVSCPLKAWLRRLERLHTSSGDSKSPDHTLRPYSHMHPTFSHASHPSIVPFAHE